MPKVVAGDEAAYALVRMYIEVGALAYARFEQTGVWPETEPPTDKMIATILAYLPPDVLPLTAEESAILAKAGNEQLPAELRRGDVIFRNRDALVEGLNTMAPATAAAVKKKAPGADSGGIEWWAVALAAGGALAMLGRLSWQGALLSLIASRLLFGAAIFLGVTAKTEDGKNVIRAALDAAADVAKDGASLLKWVLGGALVLTAGVVIYKVANSGPPKPRYRALTPRRAALDVDADDDL